MKSILTKDLDGISVTKDESEIPHETNCSIKLRGSKHFDYIFPKLKTFNNEKIEFWYVVIKDPNRLMYPDGKTTTLGYFSVKNWKDIEEQILATFFNEYDSDISVDPSDTVNMKPTITITLLRRKD